MRVLEIIQVTWTILVILWWMGAEPESAPQQAALAGQALVLMFAPYAIIATLQRGHAREPFEAKSVAERIDDAQNS